MHTSCAVTGFATKRGADSGWASQLEDVPKGHKIQGVGTKTQERDFERRFNEFDQGSSHRGPRHEFIILDLNFM